MDLLYLRERAQVKSSQTSPILEEDTWGTVNVSIYRYVLHSGRNALRECKNRWLLWLAEDKKTSLFVRDADIAKITALNQECVAGYAVLEHLFRGAVPLGAGGAYPRILLGSR